MESAISAGGARPTLDMTDEQDRGLVRQTIINRPKRWAGVTDKVKWDVVDQLCRAMEESEQIEDLAERVKARASIAKTLAMIEGQNQKDEHIAIEKTVPNAPQDHRHFVVPSPRVIGENQ